MISFRHFVYHSTGVLHKLLVLALPLVFAAAILVSSPTYVERAVKQSRVYDQFVTVVIDNSQKQSTDGNTTKLLAEPEIKAAAEKAFPPELLQSSTENVINGVFAWMQGKTAEPEFRIDLTNAKTELSTNVAAFAEKRANGLPPCTLQQLRTLNPDIDLLQIPCLPPGVNVSALAQDYSQKFLTSGDFLEDPVITNQTIAKSNDGKPISEQLEGVPQAYSALAIGKWVLLAIVLALTALLIFARRNRRAGIKHIAWTLLGIGAFLIINLIIYWFISGKVNATRAAMNSTEAMWIDGISSLVRDFNVIVTWFSVSYLVLGTGLLAYLRFFPQPSPKIATQAADTQIETSETPISTDTEKSV